MEGWRGWGEEEVGWVYGGRWSGNGGREGECVCLFVVVGSKKKKHKWPSMLGKWRYILTNTTRLPTIDITGKKRKERRRHD
jgi:hypothetical protein